MRKILLFLLLFFGAYNLWAVKAYPGLLTYVQPDGTEMNYYLRGDENFSYMVSEEGCLLTFNELGFLGYADLKEDVIVPSAQRVKVSSLSVELGGMMEVNQNRLYSPQYRAASNQGYPLAGSPKSLIILVNFSDVAFNSTTANQDFVDLLNKAGYNLYGSKGSARDYFRRASNGVFDPEFVVVGPYTLPNNREYYGEQEGDAVDKRPGNMIVDACKLADVDIDYTEFDENKDGYIDNVFVYYAGHNQAEGGGTNTVWPHRSYIVSEFKFDGVQLGDYACTSEFRGSSGTSMCGIGTFVHEFGHVLSLPDLYDTQYSGHETLGSWDVMDNGSYNSNGRIPPTYSAYERFFLGWMTPKQLTDDVKIELDPISISNSAYLVAASKHNMNGANPSPKEFFLLENRSEVNFDGVPAEGLLITRIVYNSDMWDYNVVNNNKRNMGVEICCAAGTTKYPRKNVFPGSEGITDFVFKLRSGSTLDKSLSQITKTDDIISFVYGEPESIPNMSFLGDDLLSFNASIGEEQVKKLSVVGDNLGVVKFSVDSECYSIRKAGSDDDFGKTLFFETDDIDIEIEIKFKPTSYTYSDYVSETLLFSATNYEKPITLRGCASRPIYVVPPVAYSAENIAPYTFTAVWDTVFDATEYLLSVYNLVGNDTSFVLKNHVVKADKLNKMRCEVANLLGGTDYKYRVKASDKDPYGRYENITDYSNEISVTTLPGYGVESRKLDVLKDGDKYMIYLPVVDENHSIFVYSLEGHLITSVPVLYNIVELPVLASNRVYILKYASNDGLKRKSKVIKLYYE